MSDEPNNPETIVSWQPSQSGNPPSQPNEHHSARENAPALAGA